MGAQWDWAGGRARVSRIADLAPFRGATTLPLSFSSGFARAHRFGRALDRDSWSTLLSSGFFPLFSSHSSRIHLACNTRHPHQSLNTTSTTPRSHEILHLPQAHVPHQ